MASFWQKALTFGLVVILALIVIVPQFSSAKDIGGNGLEQSQNLNQILNDTNLVNGTVVLAHLKNNNGKYTVVVKDPSNTVIATPLTYVEESGLYTVEKFKDVNGNLSSIIFTKTNQSN